MDSVRTIWPWCLASNCRIAEFPFWHEPLANGEGKYKCPDCGRIVGIRASGSGELLARHYRPRTDVKKLGEIQTAVLKSMKRSREWYPGCGWIWDTESGTRRILESLVKRGLVEKKPLTATRSKYVLVEPQS